LNTLTKLGEGYNNPDGHIPIDIHINKLLDWLVDRRKIPRDWKKQLAPVTARVKEAVTHLPSAPAFDAYRTAESLNYYDSQDILTLLPQNGEDESKNLFGTYNSKLMKEWSDIIKSYESNSIFLGEIATILTNMVNVELPQLNKTIERCSKAQGDLERKDTEYNKNIQNYKTKLAQACASLGIEGQNIEAEIPQLVVELPSIFDRLVEGTRHPDFYNAISYYAEFSRVFSKHEDEQLSYLKDIQKNGNRYMDELYTSTPMSTTASTMEHVIEKNWNIIEDYASEKTEAKNLESSIIEIASESAEVEQAPSTTTADEISWDVEDSGEIDWDIDSSSAAIEIIEASDAAAVRETQLENVIERHKFVADLLELHGFLEQRVEDTKQGDKENFGSFSSAEGSGVIAEFSSVNKLSKVLAAVSTVVDLINNPRTKQLLDIKTSKRFVFCA